MTITSVHVASLLTFGIVFVFIFGAVRRWQYRVPGLTGRASIRAATYQNAGRRSGQSFASAVSG